MTRAELDEPIPDREAADLVAGTVAVEMAAKLDTLAGLLGPPESVMVDVDQTAFGTVAEVLSRVGGWAAALPPPDLRALMRRCHAGAMEVSREWARRRGVPEAIVRLAGETQGRRRQNASTR